MNPAVRAIFAKDMRELLRDRRALFVNLVLPVLLYPLLILFSVQVAQLSLAQPRPPPKIGVLATPQVLTALQAGATLPKPKRSARKQAAALPTDPTPVAQYQVVDLTGSSWHPQAVLASVDGPLTAPTRHNLSEFLRSHDLALAVVALDPVALQPAPLPLHPLPPQTTLVVLQDDGNARAPEIAPQVDAVLIGLRQTTLAHWLSASHLDPRLPEPVVVRHHSLATAAEAVRTQAAPMIPFLVLVLAVTAAMYPAIGLLAGEREAGTLETLLSLPIRRRDLVLGKLLVVLCAALVAVIANLLSLSGTLGLLAGQLAAVGTDSPLAGLVSVGAPALLLCLVLLLPVVVAISAAALALSGFAQSTKEAQTYLTPLILVVVFVAMVAVVPGLQPSLALDLLPIGGTLLALRQALQTPEMPWMHIAITTVVNLAVAAVLVGWTAQLFDTERGRYPGLVRAGWGRFARFRRGQSLPGGPEVLGVYALAVAGMVLGGGWLADAPAVVLTMAPLLLFVLLPAWLHSWLGAYPQAVVLGWRAPSGRDLLVALALLPVALGLSFGLGTLQEGWVDVGALQAAGEPVARLVAQLASAGGLPLQLLCLAVVPAICEETLCRGTLLSGLHKSLGPKWAIALSALLFALLHQSPLRLLPQAALGVLLGWLTLRSRSVWPAALVHAGHNALLVAAEVQGWLK